jgi:hypothetical protein
VDIVNERFTGAVQIPLSMYLKSAHVVACPLTQSVASQAFSDMCFLRPGGFREPSLPMKLIPPAELVPLVERPLASCLIHVASNVWFVYRSNAIELAVESRGLVCET